MYYSKKHTPSEKDFDNHYRSEIARLKREKQQAKDFIITADKEIKRFEKLIENGEC